MFDATLAFLEHGFMEYAATGKALPRIGNRHPFMAPFDLFECADGSIVICCGNDRLFGELCKALGLSELTSDERFRDNASRAKNNSALKQELEKILRMQSAQHWLDMLNKAGVPVGPLLDVAQAIEHPQTKARNMLIEAGGLKMAGNPIKIGGYPDPDVRPAAPRLDEHGPALRQEFAPAPVIAKRAS
jgi:CoA:oxalate CoA-transferase